MDAAMDPSLGPKHILVVDDEAAIRTLLRECFELEGFRVSEARDGREADAAIAAQPVDLVALDLNLNGESGFDVARRIRARCNLPIIMITARADVIDRVLGLELGADDYITKPFHLREVTARARAVLRRYESGAAAGQAAAGTGDVRFAFDRWVLDLARREFKSVSGEVQELTTAEFDMLTMFLRRPGRVLSRDNIMDLLKGQDWSPLDRTIDSLVMRVRKKIELDPATPTLLKTVRGVGYVFAAEVRKL
jgi:DNA-binding response OmpR family regulator